jgi:hypothetical protein
VAGEEVAGRVYRFGIRVDFGNLVKVWPRVLTTYRPGLLWHLFSLLGLLPSRERVVQLSLPSSPSEEQEGTDLAIPEEMLIKLLLCLNEYRALLRKSPRNRGIIEQEVAATSQLLARMEVERLKRKRRKVESENGDYYEQRYGIKLGIPGGGHPKC